MHLLQKYRPFGGLLLALVITLLVYLNTFDNHFLWSAAFGSTIEPHPQNLEHFVLLGDCYALLGTQEEARRMYEKALRLDPSQELLSHKQ